MSRTLSATLSSAIDNGVTNPTYLLRIGFASENRVATWDSSISWNSETWTASGIEVASLTDTGATITFPIGEAPDDAWLALVLGDGTRGRSIQIYEYHTDLSASPQVSDAVLVFSGIMDEATITDRVSVKVIESATAKTFPPTSIDRPTFNYLPPSGTRIAWGNDSVVVS